MTSTKKGATDSGTKARWLLPVLVGLAGLAVTAYITGGFVSDNDWNPTVFIKFAPLEESAFEYAEELLGDVVPAPGRGHDGKFYFPQAMDPFYLDVDRHAVHLDRPTYRAQRMLYPTLAGAFGLASPELTAWLMVILNVVAMGVGTWITALLARDLGLSVWFGAAFVLNPGLLVSAVIDTSEVFAMLFFVLAVLLVLRQKMFGASLALTGAVLSRETMIVAVLGLAIYLIWKRQRLPWRLGIPVLSAGTWWFYVRGRLSHLTDSVQDTQAIGAPFKGFIESISTWVSAPVDVVDLTMGIVLMGIALLVLWRTIRTPSLMGSMVVGYSLVAIVMVEPVWRNYFDSSRALAPLITVYILAVTLRLKESRSVPNPVE